MVWTPLPPVLDDVSCLLANVFVYRIRIGLINTKQRKRKGKKKLFCVEIKVEKYFI